MSRVVQAFLNSNLCASHDGLSLLARQYGIKTEALDAGDMLVFINRACDRMKIFASAGDIAIVSYIRPRTGRIALDAVQYLPSILSLKGKIDYDAALKLSVEKALGMKASERGKDIQSYGDYAAKTIRK